MSIIIRDANFRPISTSKNLAGVASRLARLRASRIDIWPATEGTAQLGVAWPDGSSVITDFADAGVCQRWVEKRRRGAPVVIHARGTA